MKIHDIFYQHIHFFGEAPASAHAHQPSKPWPAVNPRWKEADISGCSWANLGKWLWIGYGSLKNLVGGLEHFLVSHILGIIIPID